ncbi:transcriptional regulator, TetR family [Acinetobacter marinus]|uniref:Transcriptional regulator, TetR family n=1 Tax=Acinetobacter marinus TaxID=281375 RepID=A0A1G6J7Z0_9GAMM|nr:TetR/AcrR family transcriptional regulator [Acinetobacter marinus]SDC14898.1 transcriptional regulator, TetR family [Acinetobacter marinus]
MAVGILSEKLHHRRKFIIEKSMQYVAKHGLNQLSIAVIAHECSLGPGQIYRCFKDKDEIIQCIVMNIAQKRVIDINLMQHDIQLRAQQFAHGHPNNISTDESALLFEIFNVKENSTVFPLVEKSELMMREMGKEVLQRHYPRADQYDIRAISEVMATISEGIILRKGKGFSKGVDQNALEKIYLAMLSAIETLYA